MGKRLSPKQQQGRAGEQAALRFLQGRGLTLGVAAGLYALAGIAFAVLPMPKTADEPEPVRENNLDDAVGGKVPVKFD